IREQAKLALKAARFETAMRLRDLAKRDPPGDARPDRATCQQLEQVRQILLEPGRVSRPHRVDRVEIDSLAARQPSRKIKPGHRHHDSGHAPPPPPTPRPPLS